MMNATAATYWSNASNGHDTICQLRQAIAKLDNNQRFSLISAYVIHYRMTFSSRRLTLLSFTARRPAGKSAAFSLRYYRRIDDDVLAWPRRFSFRAMSALPPQALADKKYAAAIISRRYGNIALGKREFQRLYDTTR